MSPFKFNTSTFAIVFFFCRALHAAAHPAFNFVRPMGPSAPPQAAYLRLPPAFFDALRGSTVPDPAKPRRSRGGALALEISTYPSRDPGTAPSIIKRFSSMSMPRMRRLRTVICLSPMWPGMRWPGNTREGKLEAPIEPLHLEHMSVRLGTAAETVAPHN